MSGHTDLTAVAAQTSPDAFTTLLDHVAQGFEALGAAILVIGVIWSFALAAVTARRYGWSARAYRCSAQAFGETLLLGLEYPRPPPTSCTPSRSHPHSRMSWCPR